MISDDAVVLVPAVVFVSAPAIENGRGGATAEVTGPERAMRRPLTNGRVPGRRGPSLSDLSIMEISGFRTATGRELFSPTTRGFPTADEPDRRDVTALEGVAAARHHHEHLFIHVTQRDDHAATVGKLLEVVVARRVQRRSRGSRRTARAAANRAFHHQA
jgi:hypothetical protein